MCASILINIYSSLCKTVMLLSLGLFDLAFWFFCFVLLGYFFYFDIKEDDRNMTHGRSLWIKWTFFYTLGRYAKLPVSVGFISTESSKFHCYIQRFFKCSCRLEIYFNASNSKRKILHCIFFLQKYHNYCRKERFVVIMDAILAVIIWPYCHTVNKATLFLLFVEKCGNYCKALSSNAIMNNVKGSKNLT